MNILSVIDTIRELACRTDIEINTVLHSEYHRVAYGGALGDHVSLTGLHFGEHRRGRYGLKVTLTHKCPISSFREKKISKAPYYCKQCAQPIITTEQGKGMALPVDPTVVPKMQIGIGPPDFFSDKTKDFDIGNMVLTPHEGWVHKCSAIEPFGVVGGNRNHRPWLTTKQSIIGLPFKCKMCRNKIGEEGFDFAKMVAIASIMRVNK